MSYHHIHCKECNKLTVHDDGNCIDCKKKKLADLKRNANSEILKIIKDFKEKVFEKDEPRPDKEMG